MSAPKAADEYGGLDQTTRELIGQGMFNGEQMAYMRYLSTLPPEAKCPSGWCPKDDCHDPVHQRWTAG